eukprot:Gregarina_sp_Poly_1__8818@NODE_529_length_7665_cov_158_586733_g419_i0_p7_GENE_NODE_529_length_7665_cov_158_586733_g419_i0NODE_529_length_7665_cov_158_586733_g419_i0_p7_ORF_typecomplete_len126_score33_42Prefoldin_2/PF01920_20/1_3e16ADIP/PF11559_8/0_0097TrmK/PF04816_12/0_02DUF4404/PF14357_6/3_6e02DUF4404/PF14357_6/0_038Sin3_corepress/PF08295_12/0_069Spc7/PF08317_11/0_052TLE_N/PF03920_15/4_9e02TLE_N/PF03920_15/0_087DUF3600/PF12207_8/0_79DUF3600/PF12207_8/1_3e02AAA_13/PF13166_6/0_36HAUSaugmin3/PF149
MADKQLVVDVDKLRKLSTEYQNLTEFLNSQLSSKAILSAQETENQLVLDELETLEDDAVVFKSVGPVLLREKRETSKENVEKRLKYIRDELARIDTIGEETRSKIDKLATEIAAMQRMMQQQQQA